MIDMPLVQNALTRARFATSSRLIACLIIEQLVRADSRSSHTVVVHSPIDINYKLFLTLVQPVPMGSLDVLDPTDIVPFHILDTNGKELLCPVEIAENFWKGCSVNHKQQLESSVQNQQWLFNHLPMKIPSLFSTAIEWKHYIIEGHATHPMHRSRMPFDGFESVLMAPCIKFISIPRSHSTCSRAAGF